MVHGVLESSLAVDRLGPMAPTPRSRDGKHGLGTVVEEERTQIPAPHDGLLPTCIPATWGGRGWLRMKILWP